MSTVASFFPEILQREGFQKIGQLDFRLQLTAWWNPAPAKRLQVLVMDLSGAVLIKAEKSYYLKSISPEGETWARDLPAFHSYCEDHFPEIRISFSHFRDVPSSLALREVNRRMVIEAPAAPLPSMEQIIRLQQQLRAKQRSAQASESLLSLSTAASDLLSGYAHHQSRSEQCEIRELENQLGREKTRLSLLQHLQREYERKGSAAAYTFSISSNLQIADTPARFRDAVTAVMKELLDQDRYQVKQKLQGGRLNVQVAEAEEPIMTWIEQWMGGALSPTQLQRLGPAFDLVRDVATKHMMVTPDQPIVVEGNTRHAEKHVAARFVSTVLSRLDKTEIRGPKGAFDPENIPTEAMPMRMGFRMDESGRTMGAAVFPLTQIVHACVSGTTGSGKSYFARALVEEVARQKEMSILILDPRNQFVGLLVPEDRSAILAKYEEFGFRLSDARGFAFDYFAPGLSFAPPLPQKLSSLAIGKSIVSFKGMNDQQRCSLGSEILDAAFEALSAQESERPRLLIVVDEAQLFTRKRVDESAKDAAAQSERALDRFAREARKYGGIVALFTQSALDFSHDLVSLRQMTNTKIFMRNSDREIDYAATIVGDGRALVQLPTGTALVHNANWGLQRIRVRPPYSKVYELPESQIRQLFGRHNVQPVGITSDAEKLFSVIKHHKQTPHSALNLSLLAQLAGITSRRQLQELVGELEQAGVIYTRKLPERGQPRVIELTNPSVAETKPLDRTGQKTDEMA